MTAVRTTPYTAVQVGIRDQLPRRMHNALLGHFKKNNVSPKLRLAEFRVSDDAIVKPGVHNKFFSNKPRAHTLDRNRFELCSLCTRAICGRAGEEVCPLVLPITRMLLTSLHFSASERASKVS